MSAIKLSAQKVKDVSNLKKIAEAWREAVINRSWVIDGKEPEGGDIGIPRISVFAEQLAGRSKTSVSDMVLNDANVYVSSGDKYASKLRYETITCFNGWKITYVDVFINTLNFMSSSPNRIVSYCVVCNLPANVPLETTPFGFTRGLREDGKWDEKAGLYGSKGGYVIYCDGHVTWFDSSKPAKFLKWDQSDYTTDIREAVPTSAWIACGNDTTKTDYRSDGKLVILYHAGTGGE